MKSEELILLLGATTLLLTWVVVLRRAGRRDRPDRVARALERKLQRHLALGPALVPIRGCEDPLESLERCVVGPSRKPLRRHLIEDLIPRLPARSSWDSLRRAFLRECEVRDIAVEIPLEEPSESPRVPPPRRRPTTEAIGRLLRGEDPARLSREYGIPPATIAQCRENALRAALRALGPPGGPAGD